MSNNKALTMLCLAVINQQNDRVVNWEQLECNGGTVLISILSELELKGFHCCGFLLQFKGVNICFLQDNIEWYKAYVYSESEVLVQFPSVLWTFLNNEDSTSHGRKVADDNNARHILSDRVLCTGICADSEQQLTTMLFKFEECVDGEMERILLDNSLFSP